MSFRVASRGSGSDSSRAGSSGSGSGSGSGGAGSMAMSISWSSSASSVVGGCSAVGRSGAVVVVVAGGEAMAHGERGMGGLCWISLRRAVGVLLWCWRVSVPIWVR